MLRGHSLAPDSRVVGFFTHSSRGGMPTQRLRNTRRLILVHVVSLHTDAGRMPVNEEAAMLSDIIAVAGSLAFFALCALYARAIDAVAGS